MTPLQRRTLFLIALAALGAAGMLFGPDGWHGIDVGPVGSAVVYGALCLLAFHLARHSEAAFPGDASPAERQAWVALVFAALIAVQYLKFMIALPTLGDAADQMSNPASRAFISKLVILLIAWGVISAVVRGSRLGVERDERDLRIEHGAQRAASGLQALLVLVLVSLLAGFPEASQPWMRPLIVANALIGLLIAHTLAGNFISIVRYRLAQ